MPNRNSRLPISPADYYSASPPADAPLCPRCHGPMVKTYIEHDDHSGWMCGFTCICYRPDEEAFQAKEQDRANAKP